MKKKIFCLLFTVAVACGAVFAFSACDNTKKYVEELNAAMAKIEENSCFAIDFIVSVTADTIKEEQKITIASVTDGDSVIMHYVNPTEKIVLDRHYDKYYKDGYIYVYTKSENYDNFFGGFPGTIEDLFKTQTNTPVDTVPIDIPLDTLKEGDFKYSITRVVEDNRYKYTLTVDDESFYKIFGEDFNEIISEVAAGPLVFDFIVDKKTGCIEKCVLEYTFDEDKTPIKLNLTINVAVGAENVKIELPPEAAELDRRLRSVDKCETDVRHPSDVAVPGSGKYENTDNIKFYELGEYRKVIYDDSLGRLIVARNMGVDIYDFATMKPLRSYTYFVRVNDIFCNDGKLAVALDSIGKGFNSYGDGRVNFYDLGSLDFLSAEVFANRNPYYVVFSENNIAICDQKYRPGTLVFRNGGIDKSIDDRDVDGALFFDNDGKTLYVTGGSNRHTTLKSFDITTGELLTELSMPKKSELYYRYFDGRYFHIDESLFEKGASSPFSLCGLSRDYRALDGFDPCQTLYCSESYDIIGGVNADNTPEFCVYDVSADKYVSRTSFIAYMAVSAGDTVILRSDEYIAVVDLNGSFAELPNNKERDLKVDSMAEYSAGTWKADYSAAYDQCVSDDKYVYLLNERNRKVYVLDAVSGRPVKTLSFMAYPVSIDAYGGRLVVGFGNLRKLEIFDTANFAREIVSTSGRVFNAKLYKNSIIYCDNDIPEVCKYDIEEKRHSVLFHEYFPGLEIDRKNGIMFLCSSSSYNPLIFYDLKTGEYDTKQLNNYYQFESLRFDGNYLYVERSGFEVIEFSVYDSDGNKISETSVSRRYVGVDDYELIKTLYDDGVTSVFSATREARSCVVFYDVLTDAVVSVTEAAADRVEKIGNSYFLFKAGSNTVISVSL